MLRIEMIDQLEAGLEEVLMSTVDRVEFQPPLTDWLTAGFCRLLEEWQHEHGRLIAFRIRGAEDWWALDDLARDVAGARQEFPDGRPRPREGRGFWGGLFGGWIAVPRRHIAGIAEVLGQAGALSRLGVRELPNASECSHARCLRRRRLLRL